MWNKKILGFKPFIYIISIITLIILSTSCNKKGNEEDVRKLEELKQAYLWNNSTEKGVGYIRQLKEESLRLGNDRYTGNAYYYLSNYYLLELSKRDSVPFALEEAKKYFKRAGYKQGEVLAESSLAHYLIEEGSYELALKNIYSLLNDIQNSNDYYQQASVYSVLGKIYLYSGKSDEALESFDKASEAYQKVDSLQDISREYTFHILMKSIAASYAKKKELALSYAYEHKSRLENLKLSETSRKNVNYIGDLAIAEGLLDLDRVKEAECPLERAQAYVEEVGDSSYRYVNAINMVLSKYYFKKHNYERAFQYLEALVPDKQPNLDYIAAQELKSEILFAKGDYKNAFALKSALIQFSDSIKSTSTSKQLERLRSTLQMEMQEKENELNARYTRMIIISLSLLCVLLIILLWIKVQNAKKNKKKNELIFSQYRDLDRYTNKEVDLLSEESPENNPERALFEKIKSHLYTGEAFLDPDISRESLALELGTNRQYLTEAIQENTGMTFMEYINDMRLCYARRLLSYSIDLPIDEVYITSGFNSKSTFYRLFKQKYDLTPKEIREIAANQK